MLFYSEYYKCKFYMQLPLVSNAVVIRLLLMYLLCGYWSFTNTVICLFNMEFMYLAFAGKRIILKNDQF